MLTRLALAAALMFAVSGCKKDEAAKPADKKAPAAEKAAEKMPEKMPEKAPPPAEVKLAALDLSAAGDAFKGYSMQAPEGATVKESFGAAQVNAGDGFQVEISGSKADVAGRKKEIDANDVNKLKKYHVDAPEGVLYESEVMAGKPEFHFYAAVPGGAMACENVKGPTYTQAQADVMMKACQSIKK